MGQFTDGLKISVQRRRHVKPNETLKQSFGYVRRSLSSAMKEYEARMLEVINMEGNLMHPNQQSLLDSLKYVQQVTAAMLLDLDTLELDGWAPQP